MFFQATISFPGDLFNAIYNPVSVMDLYVPLAHITFDRFRLRDAELMEHINTVVNVRWNGVWETFDELVWDSLASALSTST
jgi:hypothetical protein